MRHRHGDFFVETGDELGVLVAGVIDDRFLQAAGIGVRIDRDVFEAEWLQHVHHEVGAVLLVVDDLDDRRVGLWRRSRGRSLRLGAEGLRADQRGAAGGRRFQEAAAVQRAFVLLHGCS